MSNGHPDLVDYTAIAKRANVEPQTVRIWRQRHDDFPTPDYDFTMGPAWTWDRINEWLEATGRAS